MGEIARAEGRVFAHQRYTGHRAVIIQGPKPVRFVQGPRRRVCRRTLVLNAGGCILAALSGGRRRVLRRRFGRRSPGAILMLITPAFAQGGALGGDNMLVSLLPFILIFVIMYFLILRPQQKRVKQHAEMVKNVRRGDTVVTNGGLVGKVTKVIDDDQVEVEVAPDVRVRQMRSMLADVRAKGEPVKEESAAN